MNMETSQPPTSAAPICFRAFGGRGPTCQVDRIEGALRAAGAVEATLGDAADFVYANDSGAHQEALSYRAARCPNAKVILNVLDIPSHLLPPDGDYDYAKIAALGAALRQADAITAISQYTQAQIQQFLGFPSRVIYNPIKPVSPARRLAGERLYPYRVLLAGRVTDPNKRVGTIGIPALIAAGFEESEVAVIGGEYPGWGTNLGAVSDATLNDLFNSVDLVMQPTRLTGWELPVSEAMVCGAIPIVCHDLTTITEMPIPRFWWTYPSAAAVAYRLRVLQSAPEVLQADRAHCLAVSESIQEQLGAAAVARRILAIYQDLTSTKTP